MGVVGVEKRIIAGSPCYRAVAKTQLSMERLLEVVADVEAEPNQLYQLAESAQPAVNEFAGDGTRMVSFKQYQTRSETFVRKVNGKPMLDKKSVKRCLQQSRLVGKPDQIAAELKRIDELARQARKLQAQHAKAVERAEKAPPAPEPPSLADLKSMKVAELRAELGKRDSETSGGKNVLAARLREKMVEEHAATIPPPEPELPTIPEKSFLLELLQFLPIALRHRWL